ncbi:fimbria/pilus periplasmic chaperone [Dyella sp.]|uniref:fimbria/pilus periplasmic chaperone n=1 Tax=Dyella sp. TaxID=1869338 RepID=UPI002FDA12CE
MNIPHILRCARAWLACCVIGMLANPIHAGVVVASTRVIYPAQESQVTVHLSNDEEKSPLLLQAWIDDGREQETPAQLDMPFLLTPPVFRMEPGKAQVLRIRYLKDKPLPADKESVFWLNVLEVPPKPKAAEGKDSNTLQLAFRTRVKLFFRPKDLKGAVEDAPRRLSWKLLQEDSKQVLQVENPSAYYVSFEKVSLVIDGKEVKSDDPQMVAPGSKQRFVLGETHLAEGAKAEVQFTNIGDYGQVVPHTAPLMP